MKQIIKFLIIPIFILFVSNTGLCQDDKNKKKPEEQDIYKEFSLTSFEDAAAVKIKDSTIITQHLIGVKWGYSLSSVAFSNTSQHKSIKSFKNYGIYYTYFHSLWGGMPFFGMQIGLAQTEIGYIHRREINKNNFTKEEQRYTALELPLLSVFRADISKIRLMLGIGGFASYLKSTTLPNGIPNTTNKLGYGVMGQLGIAIKFKPIEFHIEGGYKYALSHFYDLKIYSTEYWTYTHYNQIFISAGLFFNFGGKKNKK